MKIKVQIFSLSLLLLIIDSRSFGKEVEIKWKPEAESVSYLVEISKSIDFKEILSRHEPKVNSLKLDLPVGNYYLRVCGIDQQGVKSKFSPPRQIILRYVDSPSAYQQDDKLYVPAHFNLSFLKTADSKGTLFYQIDNEEFKKDQGEEIKCDPDKSHTLSYYFADDKQKSPVKNLTLIVDTQAPQYEVLVNGVSQGDQDQIKVADGMYIEIVGKDNLSGVKEILYSYNKDVFYLYQDTIIMKDKNPFSLYFKLIDKVGNVSPLYEKKIIPTESKPVSDEKKTVPDEKETVSDEKKPVPDEKKTVPDEKETVPDEKETVSDEKKPVPDEKESTSDEK